MLNAKWTFLFQGQRSVVSRALSSHLLLMEGRSTSEVVTRGCLGSDCAPWGWGPLDLPSWWPLPRLQTASPAPLLHQNMLSTRPGVGEGGCLFLCMARRMRGK